MTSLRQTISITLMNLRAIPKRLGSSLVVVVGIAGVVGVLISVLAMASGFLNVINGAGRADRAIVLRGGSNAELSSTLSRDAVHSIIDAPGIRRASDDTPIASAESVVVVDVPTRADGGHANVTLRGVSPAARALRPEIRLVAGRMFRPELRELIVGRNAEAQFRGISIGSHIVFKEHDWTIVGMFESDGNAHESELIGDVATVMLAYRSNFFQSVTVLLDNAAAFDRFKQALTGNPQLSVDVVREPEYYARLSEKLSQVLFFIAYVVGGIMAVGALFGALNTMFSAVSARTVEIATLRAIGFGVGPLIVSVFVEALLLALAGGLIGAGFAYAFFNGNAVSTLSGNFTQVVFHLTVTPSLVISGIVWSLLIGFFGGLFPAIRAARLPVVAALRAQ